MIRCLNCKHIFTGHFCPHCGQKAGVERLTASSLLSETVHFFLHIQHGFLHTTKKFIVQPGETSLNYISGKRKRYQQPVSYVLIWAGLFILIHNLIVNLFNYKPIDAAFGPPTLQHEVDSFFRSHFTAFIIPVILISAVLVYFVLAKPRFNFIEIVTLCLYVSGTYFMMLLVFDLFLGVLLQVNILSYGSFIGQAVLSAVYNFWYGYDLFKRIHLRFFWFRLILCSLLIAMAGLLSMEFLPRIWLSLTH